MRAGLLRQRIAIQAATTVTDSQGGRTSTWAAFVENLPASVLPTAGAEALSGAGGVLTAALTTTVTIRYREGVTPQQRIVWGSRMLQIERVQDPDGRRASLELLCTEVQS